MPLIWRYPQLSKIAEPKGETLRQTSSEQVIFEGEEAGAGHAAPGLDLIAAAFLVALSCLVMAASLSLPVPGDLRTAPGLLPFLTALSLLAMAVILGLSANKRRKAGVVMAPDEIRDSAEDRRAMLLAGTVALYVLALQILAFQVFFSLAKVPFVLSAFEPVTIIALASIIHVSWRGPLWITVLVSVGWTLALSLLFQKLFQIPLPGGF